MKNGKQKTRKSRKSRKSRQKLLQVFLFPSFRFCRKAKIENSDLKFLERKFRVFRAFDLACNFQQQEFVKEFQNANYILSINPEVSYYQQRIQLNLSVKSVLTIDEMQYSELQSLRPAGDYSPSCGSSWMDHVVCDPCYSAQILESF